MNDKEKLEDLKKNLKDIEPILSKTFKTSQELYSHLTINKKLYEEGIAFMKKSNNSNTN